MCTVTFLPSDSGFLLTSNRDERMLRARTDPPRLNTLEGTQLWFPRDLDSGSTWIATSAIGWSLCLLNGAFEKHISNPPYRQSRGKVILDFFSFNGLSAFQKGYSLEGIEPFTLVLVKNEKRVEELWELKWDGKETHWKNLNPDQPRIWSSATLYTAEDQKLRESWFEDWMLHHPGKKNQASILDFHLNAGADNRNLGLVMDQGNDRQTISITSIEWEGKSGQMVYQDLVSKTSYWESLSNPEPNLSMKNLN